MIVFDDVQVIICYLHQVIFMFHV